MTDPEVPHPASRLVSWIDAIDKPIEVRIKAQYSVNITGLTESDYCRISETEIVVGVPTKRL